MSPALLYVIGSSRKGEPVSFPVEGFDGGSISMLPYKLDKRALRISSWLEAHTVHEVAEARVAAEVIKSEPPFTEW